MAIFRSFFFFGCNCCEKLVFFFFFLASVYHDGVASFLLLIRSLGRFLFVLSFCRFQAIAYSHKQHQL